MGICLGKDGECRETGDEPVLREANERDSLVLAVAFLPVQVRCAGTPGTETMPSHRDRRRARSFRWVQSDSDGARGGRRPAMVVRSA
jgi:hypothetical protein